MNHAVYPIERTGKMTFTFESNNRQGTNPVTKMVDYVPIVRSGKRYHNLAFGDYDFESDDINDSVVTDNGDMRKVLKTEASTLEIFFEEFPDKEVHIDGSDLTRRAYYHKLIRDYHNLIPHQFRVQGQGAMSSKHSGQALNMNSL